MKCTYKRQDFLCGSKRTFILASMWSIYLLWLEVSEVYISLTDNVYIIIPTIYCCTHWNWNEKYQT